MAINDEIIINECNKENKKPNDKIEADSKNKEFRFEIQSNGLKDNIKLELNNKEILNDKDDCIKIEQSTTNTSTTTTTTTNKLADTSTGGVASPITVPQTLISCLDELQHNGKLVSWKIRGEGENLTVKVTWNSKNNEKKYRKYTTSHLLNRKDKAYQAESSDKDSGYITPYYKETLNIDITRNEQNEVKCFAKLDETKISPLTLKHLETDKKLKDELNRFRDALIRTLNELKVKLNDKQSKKMDKVEYDKLLLSSRIELVSIITNLVQTLHIRLGETNLNQEKLEFDIKLIVFNEIESSLKLRSGSLLKEIEKISDSESDYPRAYEDYLATSILRKLTSKQTFSNIIEIMSANISEDLTLKEADTENWGKSVEDNVDSAKNDSYSLRPKQTKTFSVNDNLLLSLYSLIEETNKENGEKVGRVVEKNKLDQKKNIINNLNSELDLELANDLRKFSSEQDNWSFRKSKKLHENFDATKDPVVMTIPEPNEIFSPTIGDQDIEQLSDMTLNDSNEENVNYEEELMDQDELMNETNENDEIGENEENLKFPIPQNMMNTKSPKSSSYYRPVDERLESDSDSEMEINAKRMQKSIEEKAKISPKIETKDPVFTERPSDRLVRIGETAKFQCKVDGTRPLEVFWYKIDDDELQNDEKYELFHDDEYYYLKIYNTVQRDSGTYLCVISNDVDQNFDSFTLKLRDNPRNFRSPKFMLELNDIEVEEGYSATFKVKLDFGYPKCRVLFYRNSKLILNDPKHEIYYCGDGVYHLHLPYVTDEDNAQYMCVAVNNGGRAVSKAELYVAERENIRRPDMLLKLTTPSYRSLDAFKFMENDNKYFTLTKSIDSFDNRSSKSSTDINNNNNNKVRTDSPSTVSYELLNETYYDPNKYETEVVLKAISSLNTTTLLGIERNTFKSLSVTKKDDEINDDPNNNMLNDSCDANDQIQKSFDNPYEIDNYHEQDNFNELNDKNKQFYKNYSPFIENSLTLVTSPINKVSDNLLSSSSVGSSILQMITPLQQQVIEEKSEKSDSNLGENAKKNYNNLNLNHNHRDNEHDDSEYEKEKEDANNEDEDDDEDDEGELSRCGEYQVNHVDDFNDENNFDNLNLNNDCEENNIKEEKINNKKRNSLKSNELNETLSKQFNHEKVKLKSSSNISKISYEDLKNFKTQNSMNISSNGFVEITNEPEHESELQKDFEITKPVGKLSIDPHMFEKPIVNKNKSLQSEYKSLELEPVKERKKIWEQKASISSSYIDKKQQDENNLNSTKKKNVINGDPLRKWSSLVSVYDEGLINMNNISLNNNTNNNNNGSKVHSRKNSIESSGSVVVIQSASSFSNVNLNNSNKEMNNSSQNITIQNHNIEINHLPSQLPSARPVLVEIVTFDNESIQKQDNICVDETNDMIIPLENADDDNNSNIVQKLKQKFDHKDQSFVKVASLTCRNVFKDGSRSRQNNLNNIRPMLSLYEPSQCESLQKFESTPQSSRNSVLIQSNTSINTNKNSNIATITTTTIAYNTNIGSDTSTSSSTLSSSINNSTSSLKSSSNGERILSLTKFNNNNSNISHSDDNNENKLSQQSNILEMNSAKPESFCKIYDSSNDLNIDNSNSKNNLNSTTKSSLSEKSRKSTNDFSIDYGINVQDLVKDYKKLMSSNFSNSKRKESSVLSRAKLWENPSKQ